MNKKGVSWVIIGIVIVAVVVIGVVAYWAMTNTGGENGGNGDETPDIEGATSLQFDVSTSEKDVTFQAKNLGTSEVLLRVDEVYSDGSEFTYIMNQTDQTAWANFGGEWTDVSATFEDDYWNSVSIGYVALDGYKTSLADWTGTGDFEVEAGGETVTVSNIEVNPTLDDSLFQPD